MRVVQTNQSKNNSEVKYALRQLDDGTLECDCPAWRFDRLRGLARSCRHVREYRKKQQGEFVAGDGI
jgi:hypothetical protein